MKRSLNHSFGQSIRWQYLRLASFGVLSAVSGNVAASFLYDFAKPLLSGTATPDWRYLVIGVGISLGVLFLSLMQVIRTLGEGFFKSFADIKVHSEATSRKALIMALSVPTGKHNEFVSTALAAAQEAKTREARYGVLRDLCDAKGSWAGWNFQQPLRVIAANLEAPLQAVAFILSEDAVKGYEEGMWPLLNALLGNNVTILPAPQTPVSKTDNLSNYNAVTQLIDEACLLLSETPGIELKDICIDITSGTKAYSAAATVKTLNSALVFSYVEPRESPRVGEIATYDASIVVR